MAAAYLREVLALQPEGPYFLGGRCFGSMVAFEMAHQLIKKGETVAALTAIEGTSPVKRNRPSNMLPETVNSSDILEIFNALNKKARDTYEAVPLPGKIALFYAENSKLNRPAYFRSWRKAAQNGIERFPFPCGHTDMFNPPAAADLVRCLQDYLNSQDPACR
jgi:thioesterase domain-containing protein